MRRTYKLLLLLYPSGHRDRFASEMTEIFEEASAERRAEGWAWYVRFSFAEMAGLIAGAANEWVQQMKTPVAPHPASTERGWPQELVEARRQVDANIAGMVHAIANHQFKRARLYSDEERQARAKLRFLREKYGINN